MMNPKKTDGNLRPKIYMVLLVDRKKAKMFNLLDGMVERYEEFTDSYVPQKVKHGDDTWDAQDKIFRHIENHLHRHLHAVTKAAVKFASRNYIYGIIIGGHQQLFPKIIKQLPQSLSVKVRGTFVTELKAPFNEILERAKLSINKIENAY